MHICLIMDNPETPRHPVLGAVLQKLGLRHKVDLLDVHNSRIHEEAIPQADLYLLKSHTARALDIAYHLEQRQHTVINSYAASEACRDRTLMAQRLHEAKLPRPRTLTLSTLADLPQQQEFAFPLIIKSRYSYRGDLVARLHTHDELLALTERWGQEPVVVQEFVASDGWDIKLWVIDEQVFAARRRTPLDADASQEDLLITQAELPDEWRTLTHRVGRAFGLRLYGVDLLITGQGPYIVDVNAFPGFRGAPGADDALVALVEKHIHTPLAISDLPALLKHLFERIQHPLSTSAGIAIKLLVQYVRRKSGRGLVAVYRLDDDSHKHDQLSIESFVSLTLNESALHGRRPRLSLSQIEQATLEISETGTLSLPTLTARIFPMDECLHTLAMCYDTTSGSRLHGALEAATQESLRDQNWHIIEAYAAPIRYKPTSRCVLCYHMRLQHAITAETRSFALFGKVYTDEAQKCTVQTAQMRLYAEQKRAGTSPMLPRTYNSPEGLRLVLNEAIAVYQKADGQWHMPSTGTQVLRPQVEYGRGGMVKRVVLPHEDLVLTARALARLHQSSVLPDEHTLHTGTRETQKVQKRATLLAAYYPELRHRIRELAEVLCEQLDQPAHYGLAHGSFKPSQLLFDQQQVFIVDFDGICLADPALDIGYFLAYLRPASLWYNRAGIQQWFEEAEQLFGCAYRQAACDQGQDSTMIADTLARARLYTAAVIFKIATRRIHRLNSPRSGELSAMLQEIHMCLLEEEVC